MFFLENREIRAKEYDKHGFILKKITVYFSDAEKAKAAGVPVGAFTDGCLTG